MLKYVIELSAQAKNITTTSTKVTLVGIVKLVKPDSAKAFDPKDTTDLVYIYIHHVNQYTDQNLFTREQRNKDREPVL